MRPKTASVSLDFVIGVSGLLTLLYGGYLTITGEITLGQFEAFNLYVAMLVWPMLAAGECMTTISQGLASVKRIMAIMGERPEIVDAGVFRRLLNLFKALACDTEGDVPGQRVGKEEAVSAIQHADHILVLDDGKAAEYGQHDELMALGGIYRSVYEKQQLEKQLREEGGAAS